MIKSSNKDKNNRDLELDEIKDLLYPLSDTIVIVN